MCGIVGAITDADVQSFLLEGLQRLEYRGYDSAGIAILSNEGMLNRCRISGKVNVLTETVKGRQLAGFLGIGHTRWATHGKPCETNAHPHVSAEELALVHNGIIENHLNLRDFLQGKGYEFYSETDSEVIAHLVHYYYQDHKNLHKAVSSAVQELQGAFALAIIHKDQPDELVVVRQGSPLIIGTSKHGHFIASDTLALRGFADKVCYLEEGDSAILTQSSFKIVNKAGKTCTRTMHKLEAEQAVIGKENYRHFMQKEIYEQPRVLLDTLEGRIVSPKVVKASFGDHATDIFQRTKHIHIVACGTSYHAGLVAKYWLESLAGLPTQVEIASEYRYRNVVVPDNSLFIAVSQSGETADTLAALQKAKTLNYLATMAICNVPSSSLVRETELTFLTRAGIEIGVASTKAFTTQLLAFLMLGIALNQDGRGNEVIAQLQTLPQLVEQVLKMDPLIEELAASFVNKEHTLFLGRGVQYPVALEGALKLKELSYIHAEAYPAGELKHGPLALVDDKMPVVAVAPNNELLNKLKSNLHEVSARGGQLFVFVDDQHDWQANGAILIPVPTCGEWVAPIIYTIPLQLLSYHVAVAKGTDVDQPRNLAKSVTVE
ncbi:glutamine--fructose-6-phosphate transaminase (isomerizing) [Legionella sp. W05-934-2]|jgi:glucosamine--fructose-6-phosphate aminotransferase (isomerizing)|uniref:glutamine--fructose-6-phosphate transaminase (isomerizing) n=1 Tax=Legionella sp. W05-934-2 TaxID=1198649 RepID=UPI0034632749